jgi:peptide subunit release factor 1 (eRF1)
LWQAGQAAAVYIESHSLLCPCHITLFISFSRIQDKETGAELEVQNKEALLEWLANNYKKFGCTLEFVTNK